MRAFPQVSVVMPVFNGERFISASIESVLTQSFDNWELIVSDDASSDATRDIVAVFADQDSRIRLVTSERQSGPGAARNRAISVARGRWLAFLDSDDRWLPDKLALTLELAKDRGSGLTFTSYRRALAPDWKLGREIRVPLRVTYKQLLRSNVIATSTVLIDTQLVPKVVMNEQETYDDYIAWLEILRPGRVACGLQQPLTIYRKGHQSYSAKKLKLSTEVLKIFVDVERLSRPQVAWYFSNYAVRGALKHLFR
jgi:teichuronic acid biosynthesis glycosyltransferase TuaG